MKGLYGIFWIILGLVLSINTVALFIWGPDMIIEGGFVVPIGILIVQFIVIIALIKIVYEDPIIELEILIKKFLLGQIKNNTIYIESSPNKHLDYVINFFIRTLSTLKNIKEEFLHGKEIKGEVELASEIQSKLLLKELAPIPSLVVIAKSKPAGEIGGDSYDVIPEGDNYYIYVGDATGHGVGAGFIMMMVNALISGFAKVHQVGAHILAHTNAILKPRVKANLLMTLLLIRWNEKEKRLFMTGAGHENLIVYKQSQKKCYKIKSGGVALGMIKDSSKLLKEQEIKFEKDDIFILYSDGITEAINQPKKDGNEERFGDERLVDAILKAPNSQGKLYKTAPLVFNNITIELSKFMGYKHTQLDDITLVVAHYKGPDMSPEEVVYKEIPRDLITEWHW